MVNLACKITVKEIINYDILQWGETYIIISDEASNSLPNIKLVYERANSEEIILHSSNPNFKGDTIINKKNIQTLYIIKGIITRNAI